MSVFLLLLTYKQKTHLFLNDKLLKKQFFYIASYSELYLQLFKV